MATGNRIRAAARRLLSMHVLVLALVVAAALSFATLGAANASADLAQASVPARAASGTLGLELKTQLEADPELKVSASYRVGPVSSSVQYKPGGALELKVSANLNEDWRQFRHAGSLTLSGSMDPGEPKASWNQISMSAGSRADKKAIPWQPEAKLELAVRSYPNNPVRDYTEGKLTATAGKSLPGDGKPSVKGELSLGHKEMPWQPKWTADFCSSTVSLKWRPVRNVQAAASLSARGRSYPEAPHKSYTTCTGKASAAWAISKQQSLEIAASATSTVRPIDPSKDRRAADASVKWTTKTPAASIASLMAGSSTFTARIKAGAALRPNMPGENVALKVGADSALTCELSKTLKLSVVAETAWSRTGSDDLEDDDDQDDDVVCETATSISTGSADGKAAHRLILSATAGPYGGVTFSGKAIAARTDELKQGVWGAGPWNPSLELKASYRF